MIVGGRKTIVLLGMMSKMPIAGNVWLVAQYLIGFRRLGFDVYYVEAHGITPTKLMQGDQDDGAVRAAEFIAGVMRRFDLTDRWAFHSRYDGRYFGMSRRELHHLYATADLIINLHGGTVPLPEHAATGRLIYLETDPVQLQIELYDKNDEAVKFLEPHAAFFSWGVNYGHPDCKVPLDARFAFRPTLPPVLMDFWQTAEPPGLLFTTIGNWRQPGTVTYQGETYHWSKDREFRKLVDLPSRVGRQFELALSSSSYTADDVDLLRRNGWQVRDSLTFSSDLDAYRRYIRQSRGEFTVAKDQNVRLRSGWFSERSATYLASGLPVITQETGFSNVLPVETGLFGFSSINDVEAALDRINGDYTRHSAAAAAIAHDHFDYRVVLSDILSHVGLSATVARHAGDTTIPDDLVLTPIARWPTTLPPGTVKAVLERPVDRAIRPSALTPARAPEASIIILTLNGLVFTRLCLESLLAEGEPLFEVIVIDNGSTDGTPAYLRELAAHDARVRVAFNGRNAGFAAATNQGVRLARSGRLVLLNNDTIVPRGSIPRLLNALTDERIGLIGAVTNRSGNEAEIDVSYRTYGELNRFARDHAATNSGGQFDIRTATMFCAALRREVWERVGPLDERFEIGLFEDDDYAMRVRQNGYRVVCAEDVFIHHFGQASIGQLGATADYGDLFHANRARWEAKWAVAWHPYARRSSPAYEALVGRVRRAVCDAVPAGSTVLVVSKGDDGLLELNGRRAWHFPRTDAGVYAGHHPADGAAAIDHLEALRHRGAEFLVLPSTAFWWLETYRAFSRHLHRTYSLLASDTHSCLIFDLQRDVLLSRSQSQHTPE